MRKQKGDYDFPITGMLVIILVVGMIVGGVVLEGAQLAWPHIKAFIHTSTGP